LPSTVDVFINNALVSRQSLPPGPFAIGNLPVVSGSGGVRLVVRDLFGREQVINQAFYASQALLRKGLSSFSYDAGYVRENFGLQSDQYGPWVTTGTVRYGLTEQLTSEVHAEAMSEQGSLGFGGDYLIARTGTLSAYLAGSLGAVSSGGLLLLGFDRLTPIWSYGVRTKMTTAGFTQVGEQAHVALPGRSSSANLSYAMGPMGSIGMAYISQTRPYQDDIQIVSLNYELGVGDAATLSVSALANLGGDNDTRLLATLSVPLGASVSAGVSAQASRTRGGNSQNDYTANVQRNLPGGTGYGYRLQTRGEKSTEGRLSLQNDWGTYSLDAFQTQDMTGTQASASGGVAVLGSNVFVSRRIDQSFAVVEVGGFSNVQVMADNQPAGRTDARGKALIPRLRAYDANAISIDQRDLPMDASIGAVSLQAIPYFRSGVLVRFPVKRMHAATLTVVLEDGSALPADATVLFVGRKDPVLLGTDGEVYAVEMQAHNVLRAQWHGQHCEMDVVFAASEDPLPDLGTFICKGVRR
jgi:outer membrane usher protein